MNIMNYLTRKHMRGNRHRTLMTICGVIVSVAMITAVAIGMQSFMQLMQQMEMQSDGFWHSGVSDITYEQALKLQEDDNVENMFLTKPGSYGTIADFTSRNEEKPYVFVRPVEKKAYEGLSLTLVEGRMPEKEDEIAVSFHLIKNGGIELALGDTLTVRLGQRMLREGEEEWVLDNSVIYQHGNEEEGEPKEEFVVRETKTYTVVGIVERPQIEGWMDPGYSCFTCFEPAAKQSNVNAYLYYHKVNKNLIKDAKKTAESIGINSGKVFFNENVLSYYGVSEYLEFVRMIEILELILLGIIMVGSISLIYNSFAISTSERSRQFGMLSSVGATRKQKRNAVLYEAAVIGGIAIPLGLFFGVVGMGVTFTIVRSLLEKMSTRAIPLTMQIALKPFLVAIFVSILTIFLSVWIPARRAGKISAIDAIRQTKDIRVRGKKLRTGFLVRKLFGLPGELAMKNLKRNRRRYAALVFSLFISLVLFISVGSYVTYIANAYETVTSDGGGDVIISFENEPDDSIYDKIISVEGVKQAACYTIVGNRLQISEENGIRISEDYGECLMKSLRDRGLEEDIMSESEYLAKVEQSLGIQLTVMPNELFSEYAKSIGLETGRDALLKGILINWVMGRQSGYQMECSLFESNGNRKEILLSDREYVNETEYVSREFSVPILGETKELPFGEYYQGLDSHSTALYISQELFDTIRGQLMEETRDSIRGVCYFDVVDSWDEENDKEVNEILQSICSYDYGYYNQKENVRNNERFLTIISIFAYGFIALISLICLANLCNTISTSFALRRREFAMLKSMGMEPAVFSRMLRYECMFYGLKALLYGVPVSVAISYWMHKTMTDGVLFVPFYLPFNIYAVGISAVLLVVLLAMAYGAKKVRRDTIVEGLKSETD